MERAEARLYYPTQEVENEVVWVNPKLKTPFDLEVGKKSELGVFVVNPKPEIKSQIELGVEYCHGRSGYLGKFDISDDKGTKFPHIDLKGIGYIGSLGYEFDPKVFEIARRDSHATNGLWRKDKAQREIEITENINDLGIRTNRILALLEIKEIALPNGQKITVEKAKTKDMMHQFEKPVIGIRAYRFRDRIEHHMKYSNLLIHEAKSELEEELGQEMSWQQYLTWFCQNLGKNLADIHKANYYHGAPEEHNQTLVAETVDFGLGEVNNRKNLKNNPEGKEETLVWFDYRSTRACVGRMVGAVSWELDKRSELVVGTNFGKIFNESYLENNPNYYVTEKIDSLLTSVDVKRKSAFTRIRSTIGI